MTPPSKRKTTIIPEMNDTGDGEDKISGGGRAGGNAPVDHGNSASLRINADLLDAVISALPSGIILTDTAGAITNVNRAACAILQRKRDELTGKALPDLRGELEAMLWPADKGEVLLMASGRAGELGFKESRVLGFSSRRVQDADGKATGVVISFADITEQKSRDKAEAHRQRLADIGKVVSTIAHEIRNPVFAIASLAQVLVGEPAINADEDLRQIVDKILEETRRISRLVDDLLIFGREKPLERKRIDMVDMASTLIADLERGLLTTEQTGMPVPIRLHVTAAMRDEPHWDVDADAMRRVLANLIRNAWYAVTARSAERNPRDGIDVRMNRGEDWMELSVEDDGVGIADDKLGQVFEAFFTTRHNGTGLGLNIAQRLVRQHRGEISFESRLGEGTRVRILLPA